MSRNLLRISNYYNRVEAMRDYMDAVRAAMEVGILDVPAPGEEAGWKRIDACTEKIWEMIKEKRLEGSEDDV